MPHTTISAWYSEIIREMVFVIAIEETDIKIFIKKEVHVIKHLTPFFMFDC